VQRIASHVIVRDGSEKPPSPVGVLGWGLGYSRELSTERPPPRCADFGKAETPTTRAIPLTTTRLTPTNAINREG
jgi:hypothetical protein